MSYSHALEHQLEEWGFCSEMENAKYRVFHHSGAQFPRLVLFQHGVEGGAGIALRVESISNFLMVRGITRKIEGTFLSGYRRCCILVDNHAEVWVVERRGAITMDPIAAPTDYLVKYYAAKEKWKTRRRDFEDVSLNLTINLAKEIIQSVGHDLAAWIVLECEREFWQSRNTAAQIQKGRQDRLGMGWANYDHHTFRSSRHHFTSLVHLFELLGFYSREVFYAGKEAGWGAQVMENPQCRLVLLLEVDLLPKELSIDLSQQHLSDTGHYGTIGLWCALHGDSILKAGMHHLEAQFMFDELQIDLHEQSLLMESSHEFSYLKQMFKQGQIWEVEPLKIQKLIERGAISTVQGEQFISRGVLGSHLGNLQRSEGYKGFNQKKQ